MGRGRPRKTNTPRIRAREWDQLPFVLDVPTVAWVLGAAKQSVRRYAASGLLPAQKVGLRKWVFDRDTLRRFIEGGEST